MIIAIDGPAGAGKSTTARGVAQRLGFAYIDTGAMYRAVALSASESGLEAGRDDDRIVEMARTLPLSLSECGSRIFIGERDVSALIRTSSVASTASSLAALPALREIVVAQQRRLGQEGVSRCGGAVLEGRDIQTVVFPDAQIKVFLSADPQTRAARRLDQWTQNNSKPEAEAAKTHRNEAQLDEAQRDISERDERDTTRAVSPLQAAPDAIFIETDSLSPSQVIERIAQIALKKSGATKENQRGDVYQARWDTRRLT